MHAYLPHVPDTATAIQDPILAIAPMLGGATEGACLGAWRAVLGGERDSWRLGRVRVVVTHLAEAGAM